MSILLGSANSTVVLRWQGLLGQEHLERAASVEELIQQITDNSFDLILLHRLLVDIDTCSDLLRRAPVCKLFLLSDQPDHEEGLAFLKLGIVGYANTYISRERLAEAIHVINSGGVWLGQKVIQQLILEAYNNAHAPESHKLEQLLAVLTRMERKVAELVAKGRTNLEIAAELDIVERTVKAHLTAIYEKMHVANRLSLALLINQGGRR